MNIKIEDIIANSIIELYRIDGSRKVLLRDAQIYGITVIDDLKSRKIICEQSIGNDSVQQFEQTYKDWFTPYIENEKKGYILNENKSVEQLVYKFRKGYDINLLVSFMSYRVIGKWLDLIKKEEKQKLKQKLKGEGYVKGQ